MTDNERLEFIDFIKTELKGCNGYPFIDRTINTLLDVLKPHRTFNLSKFYDWFQKRNVKYMNSPLAFLNKCAVEDITRGNFDDINEVSPRKLQISTQSLLNAMRKHNIQVNEYDDIYIGIVEEYIVVNSLMTMPELISWNKKAISYLANKNKTSADFIFLFKNTKDMRALKLPYKEFDVEFEREKESWEKLIEELNSSTAIDEEFIFESETENEKNNSKTMETL
jgi:hypothetical protein